IARNLRVGPPALADAELAPRFGGFLLPQLHEGGRLRIGHPQDADVRQREIDVREVDEGDRCDGTSPAQHRSSARKLPPAGPWHISIILARLNGMVCFNHSM